MTPCRDQSTRPDPSTLAIRIVSLLFVGAAGIGLTTSLHPFWRPAEILGSLLPFDMRLTDPMDAAVSAVALGAVGVGLLRRKRLAWVLAIVLLAAGGLVQALVLRDPVGSAVACGTIAVLTTMRHHFDVDSGGVRLTAGATLAGLLAGVVLLVGSAGAIADVGRTALAELGGSAAATDGRAAVVINLPGALADAVTAVRLLLAFLAVAVLAPTELAESGPTTSGRVLDIARRHGRGALLPYALAGDKAAFTPVGLDAVVVYGRAGRFAVTLGDPIGSDVDVWAAFERFGDACRRSGLVPSVYQASLAARGRLAAAGYRCVLVGQEAVLDLAGFSLDGSRRANVRHTITRARRGGVAVEVFLKGLGATDRARLGTGLADIDARWRTHAGPELGFTIGRFDPSTLGSTAIAVAVEAHGRPSAFATFQPTGIDGGSTLDLMRRDRRGTPGALEACIAEAAIAMKERGVTKLSLGLAPLSGLATDSAVPEERFLAKAALATKALYDTSGLESFKQKFDPTWEPRYLATQSRVELAGLVIALLRLHLGGFGHAARVMAAGTFTSMRVRIIGIAARPVGGA